MGAEKDVTRGNASPQTNDSGWSRQAEYSGVGSRSFLADLLLVRKCSKRCKKVYIYARVPPSRLWTHADNACVFALMLMTPKEKTFLQNSEVLLHKYLPRYIYINLLKIVMF